jgi:hypothetical protein
MRIHNAGVRLGVMQPRLESKSTLIYIQVEPTLEPTLEHRRN